MTIASFLRNRASHGAMLVMLCALSGSQALAGPTGGNVVAGSAQIGAATGGVTAIHQNSNRAIIDWNSFDVGTQEGVSFHQPGQDAAILNRVTGGAGASRIDGNISANGHVFLLNPDGVLIGESGQITSRGGFVASSLEIGNEMFMQGGDLQLSGDGSGAVINKGIIESSAGDVVLVAPRVGNYGRITTTSGVAALGAGTQAWLRPADDQLLHIDAGLTFGGTGVDNQGLIEAAQAELKAAGGSVYDLAINQSGTVRATGVQRKGGRILLSSGGGSVRVSGTQEARNADGSGGEIYVGGGVQGGDAAIANARSLEVTESAVLDASALAGQGDGGTVVLWSDDVTSFRGSLSATGGSAGGDGGFAEISGAGALDFRPSSIDLSAEFGEAGTLLLDPDDLVIVSSQGQGEEAVVDGGTITPEPGSGNWDPGYQGSEIEADTIVGLLDSMNVILQASGSIYNNSELYANSGNTNSLTLTAGEGIYLNFGIDLQQGDLVLSAPGTIAGPVSQGGFPALPIGVSADRITIGSSGASGPAAVNFSAVELAAQTVDIDFGMGVSGDVDLSSANNDIAELNLISADDGGFSGALSVVNGGDGLTVNGSLAGTALTGFSIVTDGDLSLGSSFSLANPASSGALDLVLASTNGDILSSAPAAAFAGLDAGAGQRLLAYSTNKLRTSLATDLTLTEVAGETYASAPPSGLPEDGVSRIFYLAGLGKLTLTADDIDRLYGAGNGTLSFSVEGLLSGDSFDTATTGAPELSVSAGVNSDVGDYVISISQGSLALTDDTYTGFAFVPGTLTVTPAQLIASPTPTTITYGDSYRVPVTFTGFRNGDTALSIGLDNVEATVAGAGSLPNVGSYDAVYQAATHGNYTIVDNGVDNDFTVTPRALTVQLRDRTRTYGTINNFLAPTFDGLVSPGHEDFFEVSQGTLATVQSNVGNYAITGLVSGVENGAANYTVSVLPGTLSITPALLRLSVDPTSRVYGDSNPGFSVTPVGGTQWYNGDDVSSVTLDFATSAGVDSDVGSYGVTVSGSAQNYDIETRLSSNALTVTPAPLTITAQDLTKVYGQAANGGWMSFTASGLKASDTLADLGDLQATSEGFAADANVITGGYQVTISGIENGNYVVASANTPSLTVNPATVNLNVGTASRAYGDSAFSVTGTTADGLMAWDSLEDLGLVYSSGITDSSLDAGQTRSISAVLGAGVRNYTLGEMNEGTATVTKRQVSGVISASQRYFGATSTPNLLVLGLVNGDTQDDIDGLSFEGVHDDALTDVGQYSVMGLIQDDNYELKVPAQGTITILPRLITVEVADQFRTYGTDAPLDVQINNIAPGHTLADVLAGGGFYSEGADPHANVGNYAITGSVNNANYEVQSQVLGEVKVTPAPLLIRMSDVTVGYGDPFDVSYTLEGLQNGQTQLNIFQFLEPELRMDSFALPNGPQEDMIWASYAPQVTPEGWMPLSNYSLTIDGGTMEVTRQEIVISAHDVVRELSADFQREELYPGLIYGGGTLVSGRLASSSRLGLAYVGEATISLVPGETMPDVLKAVVTLADGEADPDADRKYDISYVGGLGDVITKNIQRIEPLDIEIEVDSTTTTYTSDTKYFTNDKGQIVDPEVCENLGKVMVDGVCDMGSNEITVNKAPDVVSPLTAGLMEDLTSEPSDILVNVLADYMGSAISMGALDTDMIYLLDDLRSGKIGADYFMARVGGDPALAGLLMQAMDGYIQALVHADPAELSEAETLLRGRYEYRARRMAEEMYWKLAAAKHADDQRRASEAGTLGGIVALPPAGHVLDDVLGVYEQDLAFHMQGIASGATAAAYGAGSAAVPIAFVANTYAVGLANAAVISAASGTEAGIAAITGATKVIEGLSATAGASGGMVAVGAVVFVAAAVVAVKSGVTQAEAANREAELESFMARLKPGSFDPANVPPAMHALIMSELATGATLGGN